MLPKYKQNPNLVQPQTMLHQIMQLHQVKDLQEQHNNNHLQIQPKRIKNTQ